MRNCIIKYFLFIAFASALLITLPAYSKGQTFFESPEQAMEALANAAKNNNSTEVVAIFGDASRNLISSGDEVEDKLEREKFLEAYNAKHGIQLQDDGNVAVVTIGPNDWLFAIPLIKSEGNKWHFDTDQGRQELLYRRIGRNERNVIQVCLAYFDAQNDYARLMVKDKGFAYYAQHFISRPEHKDGLYWPTKEGEAQSPLGELVVQASSEGYEGKRGHSPYHGYYYKILTKQGAAAKGGALDYVANDNMIGGFALLAYPAEYGNSGVMSFIVNHDGIIYQRDLGEKTEYEASVISEFNPEQGWTPVPTKTASAQ